jgi:hypothetical protein
MRKLGWRGRSSMPPDGLDQDVWQRLTGVLTAAHRGDGNTFLKLLKNFDKGLSTQQRDESSIYLAYFLRHRLAEILARRPTSDDLHDVAVRTYPVYAKVVNAPAGTLEDTLRAVFKMPPTGPQQSGARLFVSGCAAAGVLFSDPRADLAVIRPQLAAWRSRSAQ